MATQTNASSMVQTGSLNGSNFTMTETTNDSPTVTTAGNSIDGQATIFTNGSEHYTFNQTDISTAGNYSLVETGDKVYSSSATQNANDGSVSSVETGNDAYSMTETGALQTNHYTEVLTQPSHFGCFFIKIWNFENSFRPWRDASAVLGGGTEKNRV